MELKWMMQFGADVVKLTSALALPSFTIQPSPHDIVSHEVGSQIRQNSVTQLGQIPIHSFDHRLVFVSSCLKQSVCHLRPLRSYFDLAPI